MTGTADAGTVTGTDAVTESNADVEAAGTKVMAYRAGNLAGTKTRGDGLEKVKENSYMRKKKAEN